MGFIPGIQTYYSALCIKVHGDIKFASFIYSCGIVNSLYSLNPCSLRGTSRNQQDVRPRKAVVKWYLSVTISAGPQVCIKAPRFGKRSFDWYLFELVPRWPCELWFAWRSFGASLWVLNFSSSSFIGNVLTVLYYLAFPNDRSYLKCLVYGVYIFEFVQCVLIVEAAFQTFVTGFGDVEVCKDGVVECSNLHRNRYGYLAQLMYGWRFNILPRNIFCPGILCTSDQRFGTIKKSRDSNYCCESSKEFYHLPTIMLHHATALVHSAFWWDSRWDLHQAEEILQLA